ncbi:MAG: hypothetical protein ACOX4I_00335 [Anaerovoracaceae bacterium]|jgi:hypothetical protein
MSECNLNIGNIAGDCVDKVKGFLTREHSALDRVAIAGGILLVGVVIGGIAASCRKKKKKA